jgi:Glycosyl transferase family 2
MALAAADRLNTEGRNAMPHAAATAAENPLMSIVINNYNYGRFLGAAIDSALAQTYQRLEVIVVDDGSTDDSREVIASYGKRVTAVLKPNGGQGSALSAGFAASRGEIVIFLDADDALLPRAAEQVVRAWHPAVAKVQFQLELIDASGKPLGARMPDFRSHLPTGDLRDRIRRFGGYPTPGPSGSAYGRPVLCKLMPLNEIDWFTAADKPLAMLSPFFGDVVSIAMPLGQYRVHEDNDSHLKGRQLQALQRRLSAPQFVPETLCKTAASLGILLDPEVMHRSLLRVKLRMMSLRLGPASHPIPADTRLGLLLAGIRASLREPDLRLRKRLSLLIWFLSMAAAPRRLAETIAAPSR